MSARAVVDIGTGSLREGVVLLLFYPFVCAVWEEILMEELKAMFPAMREEALMRALLSHRCEMCLKSFSALCAVPSLF